MPLLVMHRAKIFAWGHLLCGMSVKDLDQDFEVSVEVRPFSQAAIPVHATEQESTPVKALVAAGLQ